MASALGIPLEASGRLAEPIVIEPYRVVHTRTHPTYGYRIRGKRTVVYAPEFYRFPRRLVAGANVAILDGATWGRDVRFARGAGGHKDAAQSARLARALNVGRVYLTHVGKRTEAHGPDSLKVRDGQRLRL
jgi:ribonuclease BN (tRNA processing enzyme)